MHDSQEAGAPVPVPSSSATDHLSRLPDAEWLDTVEAEVDDVERVLKCLARDTAKMCDTCSSLDAQGQLAFRSALARCASGKSSSG